MRIVLMDTGSVSEPPIWASTGATYSSCSALPWGGDCLHLDHRLPDVEDAGDAVRLSFTSGHVTEADVVVGADGVRSLIRHYIIGTTGA